MTSEGQVSARSAGGRAPSEASSRASEAHARFHEEDRLSATYDARTLAQLWPFVRPHGRWLVVSMALLVSTSCLALTRPLIMRSAFDGFGTPGGAEHLTHMGLLLTLVVVLEQTIAFPQTYLMQLGGARAMADLRLHVFRFLHTRSLGFFDRTPVGRLVTRVTNDVDAISEMFSSGALNAVGDLVRLLAIVAVLLALDPAMSLLAFAAVPPVALLVEWARRRIRDAFREVRAKTARLNSFLSEQVSGVAVVQAYAREERAAAEFDTINSAYRAANNRSIVLDATLDAAIEMVSSICIASVLWYAGVRTLSHRISFGTLFAFVAYIDMFFVPIRDLSARYTLVQSAMAGAERVFGLLENTDEDAASHARAGKAKPDPAHPIAFALEDVRFSYKPGTVVLGGVSLAVRSGETVAIVGATGAGKSTVASLLLRLYDVDSGRVTVLGADVRELDRGELRRLFAVVPQDVFLFPGTLSSNIAAGDPSPDRARVSAALARIDALELFERRPGGLDAPVLERGANFSAGERQLIAFARALYREPPILLLDEATASVDSDTEARLQRALERAVAGRTALVIAHRLSTVRSADRIVVMHRGQIAEQGRHEDLLAAGGIYAKLYRLTLARSPDRAAGT